MNDEERLKVECHCGWKVEGSREEVVSQTQEHVMKVHWTEATEEDVLEMAVPV